MRLGLVFLTLTVISGWIIYQFIKLEVKKSEEGAANYLAQNSSDIEDFDYIVIFGAKINKDEPSNELRARIDFALKIWRCDESAKFVITGADKEPNDEQTVISDYLMKHGVPMDFVHKLKYSNTTRNTIKSLCLQSNVFQNQKFLAISSSYHAKRIELESKRNNVFMKVSAPRYSPEIDNVKVHNIRILVEIVAILFYLLPDRVTRNINTGHGTFRHIIPKFFIELISSRRQPSI